MYMWIWKDISRQEAILILWNKTKVLKIYSRMRSYHRAGAKDVGAGVAAAEVERPAWPAWDSRVQRSPKWIQGRPRAEVQGPNEPMFSSNRKKLLLFYILFVTSCSRFKQFVTICHNLPNGDQVYCVLLLCSFYCVTVDYKCSFDLCYCHK